MPANTRRRNSTGATGATAATATAVPATPGTATTGSILQQLRGTRQQLLPIHQARQWPLPPARQQR